MKGLFLPADRLSITQAETRAEFAERSVAKLEKTIDDLEGKATPPPSTNTTDHFTLP